MTSQNNLPEVPELSARCVSPIRIPGELDVLVTQRIRRVLDTPAMQRLRRISQLGLVSLVYPGANHSRFEHSLGVYRLAREVMLRLLSTESEFADRISDNDITVFLLASLLHDVGHWPYCHPIEDLQFDWVPKHEDLARELICHGELAEVIRKEFSVEPDRVADFLAGRLCNDQRQVSLDAPVSPIDVCYQVMNGPIDIDKMDYLQRDSLHAGVPYGRNFDVGRLIAAMCTGGDGKSLAITEKGKTAAEMMVFARYVMFSEVYWHHTVRAATAMLQRLVFELQGDMEPAVWLKQTDAEFGRACIESASGIDASRDEAVSKRSETNADGDAPVLANLAAALFGGHRKLYKSVAQFHFGENAAVHRALAGRPYGELVEVSNRLCESLSERSGQTIRRGEVLVDAPPVKLEVQFKLSVRTRSGSFESLASVSPVVRSLATEQFDNFVKRVRVFIASDKSQHCHFEPDEMADLLRSAAE